LIVLGVDPGSRRTGYGAVETDGRRHRLVEMGTLAAGVRDPLPKKLQRIHDGIKSLIERLRPDALAVEDVFHAANTRTALVLGHVRGVVLLAGAECSVPVHEYPPATVKQQITGFGRAEKGQVAFMVGRLLGLAAEAAAGDATDALAVALCRACLAAPLVAAGADRRPDGRRRAVRDVRARAAAAAGGARARGDR
jgi:crossover junction endodeoxyribonuclease RuvC